MIWNSVDECSDMCYNIMTNYTIAYKGKMLHGSTRKSKLDILLYDTKCIMCKKKPCVMNKTIYFCNNPLECIAIYSKMYNIGTVMY